MRVGLYINSLSSSAFGLSLTRAQIVHGSIFCAPGELATAPDPAAGGHLRSAVAGVPRSGSFQRLRRHMTPERGNNSGRVRTRLKTDSVPCQCVYIVTLELVHGVCTVYVMVDLLAWQQHKRNF